MYIVTVLFTPEPAHSADFLRAVTSNAQTSLSNEPGCRQFDVCVSTIQSDDVFLYEVYDSKAAFDAHLASSHFIEFNAATAHWISAKVVNAFERTHPASHAS